MNNAESIDMEREALSELGREIERTSSRLTDLSSRLAQARDEVSALALILDDDDEVDERTMRAFASVDDWNRSHHRDHVVIVNGRKHRTEGIARVVFDGEGRANAMVPIAGTLGLQPVEIVKGCDDRPVFINGKYVSDYSDEGASNG